MFSGYAIFPDHTTACCDSLDAVRAAWDRDGSVIWLDYLTPTEDDLRALDFMIRIDESLIEDCLRGEQRARFDEFDQYLFLVMYGMLGLESDQEASPRKLAAFLGERFLVTVHAEPIRTLRALQDRCNRNATKLMNGGPDAMLFHIIDGIVDRYLIVADRYEEALEDLEERSLSTETDENVLIEASELRHALLDLRRVAVSQRELITPLSRGQVDFITESEEHKFRHVVDHLKQVVDVADATRERLNAIRDNYHAALALRTNATIQMLTILATIMVPMTVIAGIYGMNVPLWPRGEDPWSFWAILAFMVAVSGGLLAYFRWRKWF